MKNIKEVFKKLDRRSVIILRGLPGAGKSSFVNLFEQYLNSPDPNTMQVVSADFFFVNDQGEYVFNRHLLGQAHHVCFRDFQLYAEQEGDHKPSFLIVDNTNLTNKEVAPYLKVAKDNRWDITFITLDIPVETSVARNIHNVPRETIDNMYKKMLTFKCPEDCTHFIVKEN